MPAMAATRVRRPSTTAMPMATSPRAMTSPTAGAIPSRWESSPWTGLERAAPASWAWIEAGLELRKKAGLASFWRPAKRKVTPRKSRRGMSTHPVATVPSERCTVHMDSAPDVAVGAWDRAAAERTRLDELEVIVPRP